MDYSREKEKRHERGYFHATGRSDSKTCQLPQDIYRPEPEKIAVSIFTDIDHPDSHDSESARPGNGKFEFVKREPDERAGKWGLRDLY